jgi:DNA-binding CsgD family transcriptional regulator
MDYAISARSISAEESLVGRTGELERLDRLVDSLGRGAGGFVELVGEPGIGKTRLLRALADRASAKRALVLSGRASQFELETPFDPFVDALDDHLASTNPRTLEPLGEERLAELATALPSLTGIIDRSPPALPSEERYRIHRAVRALIELLASRKPLVLSIDDAHWCDAASFELLQHLLRRRPRGPAAVVIAYRTGTMPHGWAALADAAEREGELDRIAVGPLSEEESEALLASSLEDPELRRRVYEDGGGNPFYMRQLAASPDALREGPEAERSRTVPASVVGTIAAELDSLDELSCDLLRGAAVAGDPFDIGDAATAANLDDPAALHALDDLLERGLVRPADSPRRFEFRHPLVWRATHEASPAGWRIEAHRRLALRLAERQAPAVERAPHVEVAAEVGDEDAIDVLVRAADAVASRAPSAAARWLRSAERLLPRDDPQGEQRRVALLVPMAAALGSAGRLAECRDRTREALALLPPEAWEARTKAAVACAEVEFYLRRKQAGQRLLMDLLAALGDRHPEQAAEIRLGLCAINQFDNDHHAARAWAREALEGARAQGLDTLAADADAALAHAEARLGNVAAATAHLERAAAVLDPLPDDQLSARLAALNRLAMSEFYLERPDAALEHAARGIAVARASGQGRWVSELHAVPVAALWFSGRVAEARQACEDAVEIAQLTGQLQFEVVATAIWSETLASAGEIVAGLRAGERAQALAGEVEGEAGDFAAVLGRVFMVRALLIAAEPARARAMCLDAIGGEDAPRIEPVWRSQDYLDLTLAEIGCGDHDAADRWASRSEAAAEPLGLPGRRGWALHARAAVLLARGNPAQAARAALDSADAASAARMARDEGRARTLAGRALAAAGETQTATIELERAHDQFESLGAGHFRDVAARELRSLGRRVPRPGRRSGAERGPGALSRREREIAELVAEGRTNKEIAAALFISEKTVEKHLSHVFEKLDVRRRAAVGNALK